MTTQPPDARQGPVTGADLSRNLVALTTGSGPYAVRPASVVQTDSGGFETEPPTVGADTDGMETMPLPEILARVQGMDPAAVQDVADGWSAIGAELSTSIATLADQLLKTIQTAWSGPAASTAVSAVMAYTTHCRLLAGGATLVGTRVQVAQSGVQETYGRLRTLPDVPDIAEMPSHGGLPQLGRYQSACHERQVNEAYARQILTQVYRPAIHAGDCGVPVLPSAPNAPGLSLAATRRRSVGPQSDSADELPGRPDVSAGYDEDGHVDEWWDSGRGRNVLPAGFVLGAPLPPQPPGDGDANAPEVEQR